MCDKVLKVLVVGQTPPPYGGQAVMIQQLLEIDFLSIRFIHVRMAFSEDMDAIGRFRLRKVVRLLSVIVRIAWKWILHRPAVLYYPPAGPNRVPFFRDAAILILTRWMFKQTVFHFHASGTSLLYDKLNLFEKRLFRMAYGYPSLAIRTSALNPDDGAFVEAKQSLVVENGLPDVAPQFQQQISIRKAGKSPRILFVGALYKSKGVQDLVDACGILKQSGFDFALELVGRFESSKFETQIRERLVACELQERTFLPGVLTGVDKWHAYARADIFCFPSFFESESFGLVNIEAMQFALPVVSTNWRGIPEVLKDNQTGFLVEIRNPRQIAEKLQLLLTDQDMRERMGYAGRQVFLERFSASSWSAKMGDAFERLREET